MKNDLYAVLIQSLVMLAAFLLAFGIWRAFRKPTNVWIVALLSLAAGSVVLFASIRIAYSSYSLFGTPKYWWFLTPSILTVYGIIFLFVFRRGPPSQSVVLVCAASVLAILFVGPIVLGVASCVAGGECL